MNQVVLVGRIVENPTIEEIKNTKKTIVKIAVSRPFKNVDGIYEKDILSCILWNGIASNTTEYVKAGDVIGIRGRLAHLSNEDKTTIIAERVTFISSENRGKENE